MREHFDHSGISPLLLPETLKEKQQITERPEDVGRAGIVTKLGLGKHVAAVNLPEVITPGVGRTGT
jgi:hypothetical protein